MQKILSFNTILLGVDVILQSNNRIITSKNFESNRQSEILISSLNQALSNAELEYNNIDIFSSIVGPGNFTGIKTSLAVLKALQISTNKKIITNNIFEIISYGENNYDIILLDIGGIKYYIRDKNNNYSIIYKKDIQEFLENNKNLNILTNDKNLNYTKIKYSDFSNDKWANLIYDKVKNNIFTSEIIPLYIEEPNITKRKN